MALAFECKKGHTSKYYVNKFRNELLEVYTLKIAELEEHYKILRSLKSKKFARGQIKAYTDMMNALLDIEIT
jgi:hypothetical protein